MIIKKNFYYVHSNELKLKGETGTFKILIILNFM